MPLFCPVPLSQYEHILLAHGGGGTLSRQLIEQLFLPLLNNSALAPLHDGATLNIDSRRIAFTTDGYVVKPIFFPGGDIGSLAVNGTVNDLAMCGARAVALSASFILEEGLPIETLQRVVRSMAHAAKEAGVNVVTGDTKVVERGSCDQIFITTSGVGIIEDEREISPSRCEAGDSVILSGGIAEHGIAIISAREMIGFDSKIESDCAPLNELVVRMFEATKRIHVLRDPTRGGVASALNEIASDAHKGIVLDETAIPIRPDVAAACELLGFDPLYVANEGKLIAIVDECDAEAILAAMQSHRYGKKAAIIGRVVDDHPGRVVLRTPFGTTRIVDMLSGEQLPRIC